MLSRQIKGEKKVKTHSVNITKDPTDYIARQYVMNKVKTICLKTRMKWTNSLENTA